MNSFKRVRVFQIELFGIWKCWFLRRGETGVPGEKPLGAGERKMIDQRMKEQIKSREIKPSCPIFRSSYSIYNIQRMPVVKCQK